MSKLTKRPRKPVLSRIAKTLVAGTVLVVGCGDAPTDAPLTGHQDAEPDVSDSDGGVDAPMTGVTDAEPDVSDSDAGEDAPPIGVPPLGDAGPDVPAPVPGVPPAEDAGPADK